MNVSNRIIIEKIDRLKFGTRPSASVSARVVLLSLASDVCVPLTKFVIYIITIVKELNSPISFFFLSFPSLVIIIYYILSLHQI